MPHNMLEPVLPPDLERLIFELAAYSRPRSMHKLMLVACRVKEWLEPIVYRVAIVTKEIDGGYLLVRGYPQADVARLLSSPTTPLHQSVRNLCLMGSEREATAHILSACFRVQNIWGMGPELKQLLEFGSRLRLKRLHCELARLFNVALQTDFGHPLFAHITHLELFDRPRTMDSFPWAGLISLPHLTHLAFNGVQCITICPDLLRRCPSLRVLLLVVLVDERPLTAPPPDLLHDGRFVWMVCTEYIKDWHMGAFTGVDFWSRAEEFIEQRRTGEIDPLQYRIDKDASIHLP
ncbi:hypothetical protein FB45DRAFT_930245 [Roridomyces roridus]|uniref:F-box domain-containing protein n=1 Tax=Roridomyces roridus TaxID=1738132 RepID=A0AAD7FHN7_9AGAR|nr:hypothetical protein FB45DRAFT_930149 [Roridomyces roridus]KAJ7620463.1 hypothetical protein FB45DRAFT_930245 [Roridomyces roridus]